MKIPGFNSVPASSGFQGPLSRSAAASDSVAGEPSHIAKRLRAWATKMGRRLENALASRDLTEGQRAVLEDLNRKFHLKLERLIDTYLRGNNPDANVQAEVESFEKSFHDILSGQTPAATGPKDGLDTIA